MSLTSTGSNAGQSINLTDPKVLQALQGLLQQVGGAMQGLPQAANTMANSSMGNLPQIAIDAASGVMKKFYTKHAEKQLQQPGGDQVLNQLITTSLNSKANATGGSESTAISPAMPVQPGMQPGMTGMNTGEQMAPQPIQPSQPQQGNNILQQLGSLIHTPGSFNQQTGQTNMPTFFGMQSDVANGRFLNNQLAQQKLTGNEPLQAGEKEKIGLEYTKAIDTEKAKIGGDVAKKEFESMNTFFDNALQPKPMTGETAKQYNFSTESFDAASGLMDIFKQDPKLLHKIGMPGDPVGQRVADLGARLKASLVPARAGATQTKSEIAFVKAISNVNGVKSLMKDPSSVKFQLEEIMKSMTNVRNNINPSEETKGLLKHLADNGVDLSDTNTRAKVYKSLRAKGKA